MSVQPICSVSELITLQGAFLDEYVNPKAADYLIRMLSGHNQGRWYERPAIVVEEFLKPHYVASLGELAFRNGRCTTADQHPVAGAFIKFMLDVSRFGIDKHPLESPRWTAKQLESDPQDPALDTLVPLHQDHGDGSAVLYNYGVTGSHVLLVDGIAAPIKDNILTVINGQYSPIRELGYYGTVAHRVMRAYGDTGELRRTRLLAYYDGEPTGYQGDYVKPRLVVPEPELLSFEGRI
jgi:hypothetical protein